MFDVPNIYTVVYSVVGFFALFWATILIIWGISSLMEKSSFKKEGNSPSLITESNIEYGDQIAKGSK